MNELTQRLLKEIKDEYHADLLFSGPDIKLTDNKIISLSPSFDLALGGGIPEGTWVIVAGKYKTGKTTTALQFAANCQENGMHVYYGNIEHRLKNMNVRGIHNLDLNKFTIIESNENKILSAQDYLNIMTKILHTHSNICLIIDSLPALCMEQELIGGVGTETRGGTSKAIAQFCRQMSSVVPLKKSIVIAITHMMANTSGYGATFIEKGGNSIQYQGDIKMRVKSTEPWGLKNNKACGMKTEWLIDYSALGSPPGQKIESYIRYGYGIDDMFETINQACDLGIIEKASSWLSYKGNKFQGSEKLRLHLLENPILFKEIQNDIKAIVS